MSKQSSTQVLHQHVVYWDPDNDGIIWPQDTYKGIRAWGWSIPLTFLAAYIIHVGLSYSTVPGFLPDPFFRIWIHRSHKSKHGSDSMSFDNEGRFRPQNFEDFFSKYDRDNKGGLDASDLFRAWRGQMMFADLFGASAAAFECESYIQVFHGRTSSVLMLRVQGSRRICCCGRTMASFARKMLAACSMAASSRTKPTSISEDARGWA